MEPRYCKNKKCGKLLPPDYKYKRCEACRNARVDFVKKAGGTMLGAALLVASLGKAIIKK